MQGRSCKGFQPTHPIIVQLRFMEEDHNHQNGIQSCVLPVNQTWKCRFLGKHDQGMVDHGTVWFIFVVRYRVVIHVQFVCISFDLFKSRNW